MNDTYRQDISSVETAEATPEHELLGRVLDNWKMSVSNNFSSIFLVMS